MNNTDLVTILGNLSRSLLQIQGLLTGAAYLFGLIFVISGLIKLRQLSGSGSNGNAFGAMCYLLGGAALFFMPSTLSMLSNTTFGVGNVLEYTHYDPTNIYASMGILIQTAGILWCVRGCILMIHASEPGDQEGFKGFAFLVAGIMAFHFDNTVSMINAILQHFTSWTLAVKQSQGY